MKRCGQRFPESSDMYVSLKMANFRQRTRSNTAGLALSLSRSIGTTLRTGFFARSLASGGSFWSRYETKWRYEKEKSKKHPQKSRLLLTFRGPVELPTGKQGFVNPSSTLELHASDHLAVIGSNGSGKTVLLNALMGFRRANDRGQKDGKTSLNVSSVSFDTHREFLAEFGDLTVDKALGGLYSNQTKELIVFFGLYPVWARRVSALSNGEIRKVMLARALLSKPRVLILDQPFDGLDIASRESLQRLLARIAEGFPPLLIDIGLKKADHPSRKVAPQDSLSLRDQKTNLVLVVQREEQLLPQLNRIAVLKDLEIVYSGEPCSPEAAQHRAEVLTPKVWKDHPALLAFSQVYELFSRTRKAWNTEEQQILSSETVLQLDQVELLRDGKRILEEFSWESKRGEHWCILGPNGAGKSSISRLVMGLVAPSAGRVKLLGKDMQQWTIQERLQPGSLRYIVGCVSTDIHLQTTGKDEEEAEFGDSNATIVSVKERLKSIIVCSRASEGGPELTSLEQDFLNLVLDLTGLQEDVLSRSFTALSQGEQKVILVVQALLIAPRILVMDEASQGLDAHNRSLVLALLQAISTHTSTQIIHITHHEDEIFQGITKVLRIEEGKVKTMTAR